MQRLTQSHVHLNSQIAAAKLTSQQKEKSVPLGIITGASAQGQAQDVNHA